MNVVDLIAHKRDGGELSRAQLTWLIDAYTKGTVADYQMSALAMAIVLRDMTPRETAWFTLAMRDSGAIADLSQTKLPKIDKHSTGGVGDKVSLCLAPMVAACGVAVPMISGRGLGHTGGTLDKLESIPGYKVQLDLGTFESQVSHLGCALIGQTKELAPADRKLYALRDVTGTVESIPLITASILSKKLAAGLDGLVMDVKVGRGAFMKTLKDARALGRSIVKVGNAAGLKTVALVTSMDAPLGRTIGNALEMREAIELLHGRSAPDLLECTLALGEEMLMLAGRTRSRVQARAMLHEVIANKHALGKLRSVIVAQGGNGRVIEEPDRLPSAPARVAATATRAGYVTDLDALALGKLAMELGAGRIRTEDTVDARVGLELCVGLGDKVEKGSPLAVIHASTEHAGRSRIAATRDAITLGSRRTRATPVVIERIQR